MTEGKLHNRSFDYLSRFRLATSFLLLFAFHQNKLSLDTGHMLGIGSLHCLGSQLKRVERNKIRTEASRVDVRKLGKGRVLERYERGNEVRTEPSRHI